MITPDQLAENLADFIWGHARPHHEMSEITRVAVVVSKPIILIELLSGERFEVEIRKGVPQS